MAKESTDYGERVYQRVVIEKMSGTMIEAIIRASGLNEDFWLANNEVNLSAYCRGAKRIKRNLLGYGRTAILTEEKIATSLYSSGAANSVEEGRELIPLLYADGIQLCRYFVFFPVIEFTQVKNEKGKEAVRVQKVNYDYTPPY